MSFSSGDEPRASDLKKLVEVFPGLKVSPEMLNTKVSPELAATVLKCFPEARMRIQVTSKKAAKYIADFLIKHGWPETRKGASLEEVVHFALCAFREFTKTKDEAEDDLPRHRPV